MASFAGVQSCIYADLTPLALVDGKEKAKNYAVVIYGWSIMKIATFSLK